jgi:Cd2+/Zn2+-exporting ATPase
MQRQNTSEPGKDLGCACDSGSSSPSAPVRIEGGTPGTSGTVFRIPTMDCASEESEIRNALAGIGGVRGLGFQLSARTLRIDAPAEVLPRALDAIRQAGFDPQPVTPFEQADQHAPMAEGLGRLGASLLLAIAAELLDFFAPDNAVYKGDGMALAAEVLEEAVTDFAAFHGRSMSVREVGRRGEGS